MKILILARLWQWKLDGSGDFTANWMLIDDESGLILDTGGSERMPNTKYAEKIIDMREKFVIPGLIDAHIHISMVPIKFKVLKICI
jgi:predicted amidohydrolase YtcJ